MNFTAKWGQYFLKNAGILEKIIELSNLTRDDYVVEIGTGPGNLTRYLSQRAGQVFTFEIDTELFQNILPCYSDVSNVKFYNQDFLQVDLLKILGPYSSQSLKVVANIPYSISTFALFKIIQTPLPWVMLVIMVQKEFGQKILAQPGEKARVPLSIIFQMRFQVIHFLDVPRGCFQPTPRVDSVVLQCVPQPDPVGWESISRVAQLAQCLFQQRRKKIRNILHSIDSEILRSTVFPWEKRPEELTQSHWLQLIEIMEKSKERTPPHPDPLPRRGEGKHGED